MKTTIEISDALLVEAKCLAKERGVSLRQLIEAALRLEIQRPAATESFELEDHSYGMGGMAAEFVEGGWPAIRDEIYRGRGT